jgi:hypothetical protein
VAIVRQACQLQRPHFVHHRMMKVPEGERCVGTEDHGHAGAIQLRRVPNRLPVPVLPLPHRGRLPEQLARDARQLQHAQREIETPARVHRHVRDQIRIFVQLLRVL